MRQIPPEEYGFDAEGEPAEEYIADRFRWRDAPELDDSVPVKKTPKARHDKLARQRAYLAAYAETGNKKLSCGAVGVSRMAVWYWEHDETTDGDAFRALLKLAEEQAVETLEAEARRRAVHGTRKVKRGYNKDGDLAYEHIEIDYSDTLLIFLLKGAAPDKYADRAKIDHRVDAAIRQEAERMAADYGIDADELIREAESIVKGVGK